MTWAREKTILGPKGATAVTLKELAERLGLDVSTVSRALCGSSRVKQETRERILAAAKELNYVPNLMARGLRSRTTRTVALVSGVLDTTAERKKLSQVGDRLWQEGFHMFIGDTQGDLEREVRYVESFLARRVDGMIVDPVDPEGENQHLVRLARERFPLVLLKRTPVVKTHTVYVDYAVGGAEAMEFLTKDRGRTRVAFFVCSHAPGETAIDRVARKLNITLPPERMYFRNAKVGVYRVGYECVQEMLSKPEDERADAIFCDDDRSAIGALLALSQAGVRVPEQISVVGMDDLPCSEFAVPPLTTVAQPKEEYGLRAAEVLLEAILKGPSFASVEIAVSPKLIVRASA